MKKIFAFLSFVAIITLSGCNKDFLDTTSTQSVSGVSIFADSEKAMTAVNGMFREFYMNGWGSGWDHENGGLPAYILAQDLMGEDHLMDAYGSGWFYEDYRFGVLADYTSNAGRQYHVWNFYYTVICNANYIIAYEDNLEGDPDYYNYVMGQAYAVRSFAYMMLVQSFQQNGGAEGSAARSLPGVPLYNEPTVAGSKGKGRGTVQDVYEQANADIDKAIAYLSASSLTQLHKSHISLAVAYGIKARHALVQQDFDTALEAAQEAMKGQSIGSWDDIKTVNDVNKKNVLWGLAIQTDQAIGNAGIFAHMDADSKNTYSKARHLIANWLYDEIPDTDARKAWWTAPLPEAEWGTAGSASGSKRSWCQKKLVFTDAASNLGDHILMRTEELYLIAAEASCEKGDFVAARNYLKAIGTKRDSGYEARLAQKLDDKTLNSNTVGAISTLMDEIFFQRRVELWGEYPRLLDLQRRGLCYDRAWEGTNHTATCTAYTSKPGSANFIWMIPHSEFDGNESLNEETDQNPGQGKGL
ncbi:MAG: RagB/SusD family nutrient uptake outer membrane protein [Bacteroidales bacterium]|nr:RagB/SusD family nutrient uptake outer membrane protein [Bacteroidales bacterium]